MKIVFNGVPWATKDDVAAAHKTTRALIREVLRKLEVKMGKVEDALMEVDAATNEIADDLQSLLDNAEDKDSALVAALQPRIERLRELGKLNDVPLDGDTPPAPAPGDGTVAPAPAVDPNTGNTGAPLANAPEVGGQPLTPAQQAEGAAPVVENASPAPGEPK